MLNQIPHIHHLFVSRDPDAPLHLLQQHFKLVLEVLHRIVIDDLLLGVAKPRVLRKPVDLNCPIHGLVSGLIPESVVFCSPFCSCHQVEHGIVSLVADRRFVELVFLQDLAPYSWLSIRLPVHQPPVAKDDRLVLEEDGQSVEAVLQLDL